MTRPGLLSCPILLGAVLLVPACRPEPMRAVGITPASELAIEPAGEIATVTTTPELIPRAMVVFGIEADGLLPLACFSDQTGLVRGGLDCLGLVSPGDEVVTDRDQRLVLSRPGLVSCPRGVVEQQGIGVIRPAGSDLTSYGSFAVWPGEARGRLTLSNADLKPTADEFEALDALLRETLAEESTEALPAAHKGFAAHTGEQVDLDGDGSADRVFSGVIDALEGLRFTGLVGFLSTRGNHPAILYRDPARLYYLRGSVDLDGSGGRELVVTRSLVEHTSGAPTEVENAIGVLGPSEYRFFGLPCPLVPAQG